MARKTNRTPGLGSISRGTLREEDLVDAFLDELCHVAPRAHGELKRDASRWLANEAAGRDDLEDGSEIVHELFDALNDHAPPFLYFGANDGDGADFGWWPSWENIDELDEFEDTGHAARERFVGEFKVVNDHGNVEVYVRHTNGRVRSILGIV